MENPPTAPQVMNFRDLVVGDKLEQVGDKNIGRLVNA